MKGVPSIPRKLLFVQPKFTLLSMVNALSTRAITVNVSPCFGDTYTMTFEGLCLPSLANGRKWKDKATHSQLCVVLVALARAGHARPLVASSDRVLVSITRYGPKRIDSDNGVASAKSMRDAVALWLGIDDGDPRFVCNVKTSEGPYRVTVKATIQKGARRLVGQETPPSGDALCDFLFDNGAVLAVEASGAVTLILDKSGVEEAAATGAVKRWIMVTDRRAIQRGEKA